MPINEALVDFDGNIDWANWYFDNAEKYLSPETTFEFHLVEVIKVITKNVFL